MGCTSSQGTNPIIKRPYEYELVSDKLQLLIDGFIRSKIKKNRQFPQSIIGLCQKYYPKKLYFMILNKNKDTNLKLTLCDASRNDTKLTSNNIIDLNHDDDNKNNNNNVVCGLGNAFCYIKRIEIMNNLSKRISDKLIKYGNNKYNEHLNMAMEVQLYFIQKI